MTFEKILEKKPTDGTVSMQVFIPKEIHQFAADYVANQPPIEYDWWLATGDIYLNFLLKGIANIRRSPESFTAKREKKEVFEQGKVYTVIYCPSHVNTQIEAIREKFGGVSRHGKSTSKKWSGRVPKRQIFSFLLGLGFKETNQSTIKYN